jgi:O-antigen/teichoic acid export membrane protein
MSRDVHQILKHTAIYLLARGLPGVIAFLAIPIFSRLLDPAAYGKYALVFGTVSLLNATLFQWLRLSLVRYLPAYRDDAARLKSTILSVEILLIGLTGVCAAVLYVLPATRAWHDTIWTSWLLLSVLAAYELCCEHTRASIRPWRYMLLQVARVAIWVALGSILAWMGYGWWAPLAAMVVGLMLPTIYAYRLEWTDARPLIDRQALVTVARYGIPLSATVALAIVINTSDRFLIAWLMDKSAAGRYSVAYDLAGQTLTLLMMVVYLATFPLAVRTLEHQGAEAARRRMKHNGSLMLAVGVPAATGFALLAPNIAHCFLGGSFRSAAVSIIPLVGFGAFLGGFKACHLDAAFQFSHRTIDQVWIVAVAAISNVLLNLVAIPRYGVQGAAWASVVAYIISIVITAWYGRRYFAVPTPILPLVQVLLASGVMALVLVPLRSHLGPLAMAEQVVAGVAVYALVLMAMNFLDLRKTWVSDATDARDGAVRIADQSGASVAPALVAESI